MHTGALWARAAGLALGVAIDRVFGDPQRHHPVAWFGTWAAFVERRSYGDSHARGAAHLAVTVAPVLALGLAADAATRRSRAAGVLLTAAATATCLGARSLADEGERMAASLEADLDAARERLPHLCGRDPEGLDAHEIARATVESLAENTADSAVATLVWGSAAGVTGALVHRAVNTLDAMVGHRTARYARFGTASARADDLLDLLPARLTGALACLLAPLVGGSPRSAARVMLRDAPRHPSPNAGWCEAAWAGAVGVRLGGTNVYGGRVEQRAPLGDADAPRPDAADLRRAARLVSAVTWAAATLACGATVLRALTERTPR